MRLIISIFFIILASFVNVQANYHHSISINSNLFDLNIKGKITDTNGLAIAGASINIKGTNINAVSDTYGIFSILAPNEKSILVIAYTGYTTKEILVLKDESINVILQSSIIELNQVVVVGYGTQNKKDITGAVKSIKAESFNRGIINSPQQLLQGKVSGVNVTTTSGEPGAIIGISVRGPGGVRTGSTPLFVVDGIPLDNSSTGGGDPLNYINPQDIESMDVLKDASATAIYGSRGANGVILITTKKGKVGFSNLSFNTNLGVSSLTNALPVFNSNQFKTEVGKLGIAVDDKAANTDWQKIITRNAFTKNHNLSLSGGADRLTYFASFGIQKQEGIIKGNDLDRYNGRFNATQKFLNDRLVVEANMSYSETKNIRPNISSMIGDAISNNPTYPAIDPTGKVAIYQNISNPLLSLQLDKDITNISRLVGNISPSFTIIKGLIYKLNLGIDNSTSVRDIQSLPNAVPLRDGRLESYNYTNRNKLIENYLTYQFNIKEHNFSALAGASYQEVYLQGRSWSINKFPITPVEPIYNPALGQELTLATNKPSGYAVQNELQSFYSRINYSYKNKYLATANFRIDGSTKFGDNNKYGYFPSFSLGWRITEEDFMKTNGLFNNLKLRASWGQTGNQEIPSKITQALFTANVSATTSYPLFATGSYPAGITYSRLANPNIQWEVSEQTDLGLDFILFKNRLTGTIDWFNKKSTNILLEVIPADPIQPASTYWTNVANMNIINSGLELELDYKLKNQGPLQYGIGGNITFIKNVVKNSPYSIISSGSASGSGLTSATINGYINDQPIGTFFLKEFTGIDASGLSTYKDTDGDGIVTDKDRIAAGSALPKVLYNFYGNISYKGFDASINFNGVSGNKIYDNTANSNFYKNKLAKNVNTTAQAIIESKESNNNSAPVSTRYLKEGAFLRLNNILLGYSFNVQKLGLNKLMSGLRMSLTGQNLLVITKYDGFDPEVNTDRTINGISSYGIDYLSYPKAKSFIFGINITF